MTIDTSGITFTAIELFFVLAVGYAAYKFKFMDDGFLKKISNFIICVANPFMILGGLLGEEKSTENLKNGFMVLGIAFVLFLLCGIIAYLSCAWFKDYDKRKIGEFSTIFSNCGFMGFPVLYAAMGSKGKFYCAFFLVAFNLVLWTYGISIMARKRTDIKRNFLNTFFNFGTVPCFIGIILYIIPYKLPAVLTDTFDMIGGVCTPFAMFIIGGLLASVPLKSLFTESKVYYLGFVKLVLLPLVTALICKFVGMDEELVYFFTLMVAMPSASNTAMYAEKYDIAPVFGATVAGMSTAMSVITIPLVVKLTELIINLKI